MLRLGLLLLSAYTLGHGHFRDLRPQVLDLPLALFHDEVNAAIDDVTDRVAGLEAMHPQMVQRHFDQLFVALTDIAG